MNTIHAEHTVGISELHSEMVRQVDIGLSHGIAVCAIRDGSKVNLLAGSAVESSLFFIFSMIKPMVAATLWRLYDRGLIGWDDPIIKYWPEFDKGGKEKRAVTIEHLLLHTAGMPSSPAIPYNSYANWDEVTLYLQEAPLEYPVGSRFEYHSLTFGWLVGEIAARVSGKPFAEVFSEEVTEPLGLHNTSFSLAPADKNRIIPISESPTFERPGLANSFMEILDAGAIIPGAGGISTAEDVARFYSVMLAGGKSDGERWLSQETVNEVTSPRFTGVTEEGGYFSRTLGMSYAGSPPNSFGAPEPLRIYGHGGIGTSSAWGDPETGMAAAIINTRLLDQDTNRERLHRLSDITRRIKKMQLCT